MAGVFGLIASPALAFSARVTSQPLKGVYAELSIALLVAGSGLTLIGMAWGKRDPSFPHWAGYTSMSAVIVAVGGFILALAPDVTVFVATLVGALVGGIISKLETLGGNSGVSERRVLALKSSATRTRRVKRLGNPRESVMGRSH